MLQYKQNVRETKRSESNGQNLFATAVDLTVDTAVAVVKIPIYLVKAPFLALGSIFSSEPESKSESIEKKIAKYNINLKIYLKYSDLNKLDKEKQLIICAAAASAPLPPGGDPENAKKILIALLASALLATSGVAIVIYSGSSGLLSTMLIECGTAGINHCISTINNNEKFLWKEWFNEIAETASETLVLGAFNKLRQIAPFRLRGIVNRDIINALCNVYDLIEPFSNVVICIIKKDDPNKIMFEVAKSLDDKYSTSFSGVTLFETKIVNKRRIYFDGQFVEREAINLKFKIYFDKSILINTN